jgi:hypothetical protein
LNKQHEVSSDKSYKQAFVDFIESKKWHWFITIPIGACDGDEDVVRRLRLIEATLCGRHLVNRHHKLPDEQRFSMVVAFEGQIKNGDRHAHILAHIPPSTKRRTSHEMMIGLFPGQFRDLWATLKRASNKSTDSVDWFDLLSEPDFKPITPNRKVYVVKHHRLRDVPWSRFDFVTPLKSKPFTNKTLSVIQNRNTQRRRALLRRGDPILLNKHAV